MDQAIQKAVSLLQITFASCIIEYRDMSQSRQ